MALVLNDVIFIILAPDKKTLIEKSRHTRLFRLVCLLFVYIVP